MHTTHDYAAHIRQQGFRLTPQRQLILDAVCEGGGHTTVDEIYERVQVKSLAVNRSTVYRNLEFLQSVQLIVTAEIGGRTVYEIAHDHPHHHLLCRACGQVVEINQDILAPAFIAIAQQHGFRVDTDHLVLSGRCTNCYNVSVTLRNPRGRSGS